MRHAVRRRRRIRRRRRRGAAQELTSTRCRPARDGDFANSCSADAQPAFARGMALLHSFEFGPAIDGFNDARPRPIRPARWPYWGIALAQWSNPFAAGDPPAGAAAAGRATPSSARRRSARRPSASATIIAAVAALYDRCRDRRSAHARASPTATRWRSLAATYPDDPRGVDLLRAVARGCGASRPTRPTPIS